MIIVARSCDQSMARPRRPVDDDDDGDGRSSVVDDRRRPRTSVAGESLLAVPSEGNLDDDEHARTLRSSPSDSPNRGCTARGRDSLGELPSGCSHAYTHTQAHTRAHTICAGIHKPPLAPFDPRAPPGVIALAGSRYWPTRYRAR